MEVRISDPLKCDDFMVTLVSFTGFEMKWSEVQSASRDLVDRFPQFIFSPEIRDYSGFPGNRIWVVRGRQTLNNQDESLALEARLRFLGLMEGNYFQASTTILNHCLRFTIQARVAPDWNRMGPFLVRDSGFLDKNRLEAIQPQLQVTPRGVCLAMEAKILRWYRLDLVDLQIDFDARTKFEQGLISTIPHQRIGMKWLLVLPNLSKGRLISISKNLISSLAIRSYADMRLYWRNVHGYDLPEEDPKFYCNVVFGDSMADSGLFCYPEYCTRSIDPFSVPIKENVTRSITQSFLQCLANRVPSVCGQKLIFSFSDAMETIVDVGTAREEHSGLIRKPEPSQRSGDSGKIPGVYRPSIPPRMKLSPVSPPRIQEKTLEEYQSEIPRVKKADTPLPPSITCQGDQLPSTLVLPVYAPPAVNKRPFIPCFKPASKLLQVRTPVEPIKIPTKPTFVAQKIRTSYLNNQAPSSESSSIPPSSDHSRQTKPSVPNFRANIPKNKVQNQNLGNLASSLLPPVSATSMMPLFSMPKPISTPKQPKPPKRKSENLGSQESSGGSAPKRSVSAINLNLDIPTLAATSGLAKVNVATLYDWCKRNGVPARSKDKKGELVDKVLAKLNLLQPTTIEP